jgi:hypothetical protein
MPRNVRNFWLTLEVDGKKAVVATGPTGKDGGFDLRIRYRNDGAIADEFIRVRGFAQANGALVLDGQLYKNGESEDLFSVHSER